MPTKNVLLIGNERYAVPILAPLAAALETAGYAVHYLFVGSLAGATLPGGARSVDVPTAVAIRPYAVYCALNWAPRFVSGVKVQLFHGFDTNKHSDRRGHFRVRGLFDLYCTQGPATTEPFRALAARMGHFAVAETGWCKLDPLFSDDGGRSQRMRELAAGRPVVMFASTFTERVSAAPHLHDAIRAEIARGAHYWLLTLHPRCPPELQARYRSLAGPNATFVEPEDIVTAQRAADVLVSDTTSVVPEFVVQHKPVVTFRHRMPKPYMLDFTETEALPAMLARALQPDAALMQAVRDYADSIHPYRDGRSSERVIQAVDDLAAGRLGPLRRKPLAAYWRDLQLRRELGYWGPASR
jgi:CDP-glycerol glycerophosphotransferase (TagB/SpsB family)